MGISSSKCASKYPCPKPPVCPEKEDCPKPKDCPVCPEPGWTMLSGVAFTNEDSFAIKITEPFTLAHAKELAKKEGATAFFLSDAITKQNDEVYATKSRKLVLSTGPYYADYYMYINQEIIME